MKSRAILLAVAFTLYSFDWTAAQDLTPKRDTASGLSCAISVPSPADKSKQLIPANLILTNNANEPIRVCTLCMAWRGSSQGALSVFMDPEHWKSGPPTFEQFAQNVETVAPGKSVSIPFEIVNTDPWMRTQRGADSTIEITAHYAVEKAFAKKLNIWHGRIEAKKFTIHFQ
jgi:hypothetical protein